MLRILITKELRSVILSPKFPVTFAVCSIIILLSVLVGIREYRATEKQAAAGQEFSNELMREQTGWSSVSESIFRSPDPMQILVSGVAYDLGRVASVDRYSVPRLVSSVYTGDPILAVFRFLDFSFIVLIVLSLLAIVFTYDAICGEREAGTLRLVFSHRVSRANYLIAKCLGSWLGLMVPLGVPILIGILMIQLSGISFGEQGGIRLLLMLAVAMLFVSFFVVFGVMMSALTRRTSASFLLCLMSWILLVFAIPRIGIMLSSQLVSVPTIGSISSERTAYMQDQWNQLTTGFSSRLQAYYQKWDYKDPSFDQKWQAAEESLRATVSDRIWKFEANLLDDQRHAQVAEQRLAFALSRISPASVFQIAVMVLANTDLELKQRYEEALSNYSVTYRSYLVHKEATSPPAQKEQTVIIPLGKGTSIGINGPRPKNALDLSDLPQFNHPTWPIKEALSQIVVDVGLLLCFILASFAIAWAAFMRYDLR